ncbi:Alpha/Beta hydrolase protein [Dichotomopilus funicola]|uniref:Carboxylic ester hydrolase n=1 Tax=Dichotomopilus funicola TaxID=1934379 RepID=A0AAN6ZMT5_9PEZI|nr:Alpha/Beta hydrolase protein [Dichotomopilus funicola]
MKGITAFITAAALVGQTLAAPPEQPPTQVLEKRAAPTVTVEGGSIIGSSRLATEAFKGIPFAKAPVGPLRLKPPVKPDTPLGVFHATGYAPACPQFLADNDSNDFLTRVIDTLTDLPFFQKALNVSEDCLTIDVIRPAGTKAGDKLPVLFWIFGGGFEFGWSSMYDAGPLVSNAVNMGKPYIYVGVNYRVGGFGFMPGKEILADGAANLGLLDQRLGLEWVADNIAAFGGDPDKVTIWGESAGSISVWNHMVMYDGNNKYNGKPLFRGGIMNSGSVVPTDPVDCAKGQAVYDAVVAKTTCVNKPDTLSCLRALPYDQFLNAANSVPSILSYNALALSYLPRPDGKVLTQSGDKAALSGKYAAVPMIIGDQEDEGTLFALFQPDLTTTDKVVKYLKDLYFATATTDQVRTFVNLYPTSITAGSPFGSGIFNEIYPGFKRLAAILGDMVFTLSRRVFLEGTTTINPDVPAWSYIASYDKGTPIMGTFHASDLLQVFFGVLPNYASKSIQGYYANFVYNLNPNDASGGTSAQSKIKEDWPQWRNSTRQLMNFFPWRNDILKDDFRDAAARYLLTNLESFYF